MKLDPQIERKAVMRGATWKKVSSRVMVLVLCEGFSRNQPASEFVVFKDQSTRDLRSSLLSIVPTVLFVQLSPLGCFAWCINGSGGNCRLPAGYRLRYDQHLLYWMSYLRSFFWRRKESRRLPWKPIPELLLWPKRRNESRFQHHLLVVYVINAEICSFAWT
jgi:hypothetical protein